MNLHPGLSPLADEREPSTWRPAAGSCAHWAAPNRMEIEAVQVRGRHTVEVQRW